MINIKTGIDSIDIQNRLRNLRMFVWINSITDTHFLKDCFPGLPVALIRIVWNLLYPNEQSYLLRASRPVRRCFYLTSHTQGKREEYSISWKTGRGFMNAQRHTNCMIWSGYVWNFTTCSAFEDDDNLMKIMCLLKKRYGYKFRSKSYSVHELRRITIDIMD